MKWASNRALLPGPPARNRIGSRGGVWGTAAGTRTTASRMVRPLSFGRFSGTISTPQLALSKPGTGSGVCGHGPGSNLAGAGWGGDGDPRGRHLSTYECRANRGRVPRTARALVIIWARPGRFLPEHAAPVQWTLGRWITATPALTVSLQTGPSRTAGRRSVTVRGL